MAASLRRALDLIDSALEAKEEFDARSSDRSFNLSLGDAGDLLVIPPLMQHLKHCHSNIQIHTLPFWSGNIKRGMLSGDVDLALWIEPFDQEGGEIISQQIGSESNMCVVRKDHPAVGDSLSLEQYAALKHMIIRLPGDYGSTVVDRELWGHDLQRKIAMSVHNLHSYPAILKSTDLVGTLPRSVAHSFASMYDLKVLPLPFTTDLPIYLSWPQTLDTDAGHQWLRNMVTAFYQENVTKIAEPTTDD
jgi:DNA-binding transcriptional LysR family regulator